MDFIEYRGYNAYVFDKGVGGGHMMISRSTMQRDYKIAKTDAFDKFSHVNQCYVLQWGGPANVLEALRRFVHVIEESEQ